MRIGVLTTSFPRHDADSAGVFVLGFARALAARGQVLDVLAPEPHDPLPRPAWPGVALHWVPYVRPRALARTFYGAGVPDNAARDPRAWPGLVSFPPALVVAARRRLASADALVSHWALPCALVAGLVRAGRPHVAVLHSADVHLLGALPARASWALAIAAGATTLVFTCEDHRARFLGWLPAPERDDVAERAHVQPMGCDLPGGETDRVSAHARRDADRCVLLTVGRLVPVKGLVEAASALAGVEGLEWWIAGDGPERAALERIGAGARARIRLLGEVHGPRKAALFEAADAYLLPSRALSSGRTEGVPTAIAEAMSYGLPVVASRVGGIPEQVRDGVDGLLVDPTDPAAFVAAVERLCRDVSWRRLLGKAALAASGARAWGRIAPRFEHWLAPAPHAPPAPRLRWTTRARAVTLVERRGCRPAPVDRQEARS